MCLIEGFLFKDCLLIVRVLENLVLFSRRLFPCSIIVTIVPIGVVLVVLIDVHRLRTFVGHLLFMIDSALLS